MSIDHLEHLPLNRVSRPFERSYKTHVFEIPADNLVLKMDVGVIREHPQPSSELVGRFIESQQESEAIAMSIVPNGVIAPKEHHFIAEGEGGVPTAFRIQKRVIGNRLRDLSLTSLSLNQKKALRALLWRGLRSNLCFGVDLDIVGTTDQTSTSKFDDMMRGLNPISNSVNVLASNDGRVFWVDVKGKYIPNEPKHQKRRLIKAAGYLKDLLRLQWNILASRQYLTEPSQSEVVSANLQRVI